VNIGLAVVLVKAVVDEHSLGGCSRVVDCMSVEVDSLGERAGIQVVGCKLVEVDNLAAAVVVGCMIVEVDSLAAVAVVGCMIVEVDSLAGMVLQQRRLEHGPLGMVNSYAPEDAAEEAGPFLADLDCMLRNVTKPRDFAERPMLVGIRGNED
jgi:hypothetical protein